MSELPPDLARALTFATQLQADSDVPPHTITAWCQYMANALHRHRALVAAAPELLAALKGLVEFRDARELENGMPGDTTGRYNRARLAIAKAERK